METQRSLGRQSLDLAVLRFICSTFCGADDVEQVLNDSAEPYQLAIPRQKETKS